MKERAAMPPTEHFDTIVIGAGQAGLSTGYHLKRQVAICHPRRERAYRRPWRSRWTRSAIHPARVDGLAGMPFRARGHIPYR
jgi:putative flavoprotein involved in K+ transport